MIDVAELIAYLNEQLQVHLFEDYCPNGLQIAGKKNIAKIVSGVSANRELINAAIQKKADLLLVHHGFFWKGEQQTLTGIKYNRIAQLIKNNINLVAYHLPLDAHSVFGNNIQLAKKLDLHVREMFDLPKCPGIIYYGNLNEPASGDEFAKRITEKLQRKPLHISNDKMIHSIAWCTGAAQDYLEKVSQLNVDAYLTGEVSERTVSMARELNIHFYAAGHHATERFGIQALGEHLQQKFGLQHEFIDIENPI